MRASHAASRLIRWVVTVALLAAVVIAVVVALMSAQTDRSDTRATPSVTPTPSQIGQNSGNDDIGEDIEPRDSPNDCRVVLAKAEYDAFVSRLFEFEAIHLLLSSDERAIKLVPYATSEYLETQTSLTADKPSSQSIELQPNSAYGCYIDSPNTITAYVIPTVDIVDTTSGGVQKKGLLLSIHYTQWINVNGTWYVNQERN